MSNFAVLRIDKLKSPVAVLRSMKHSFRTQETPNAVPERLHLNTQETPGVDSVGQGMAAFRARLPEKHRKDAVQCIEYLISASAEAINAKSKEEQDAYFRDALKWLQDRHGAENVVLAGVHRDERAPHMYAYVVPIDSETGRLNAKKWFGGAKALNNMQTDFAKNVATAYGFERGIEGSKAKHQRVSQYYAKLSSKEAEITPEEVKPQVLEKKLFGLQRIEETEQGVAERLNKKVSKLRDKALRADFEHERAERYRKVAEATQELLRPFKQALDPLNADMRKRAMLIFDGVCGKLLGEQKQEEELKKQQRELERQQRKSKGWRR